MSGAPKDVTTAFRRWYDGLKHHGPSGGPARGTICAALVVLEKLRANLSLDLESYRAKGRSQISGVSSSAVSRILSRFGEERPFLKEGGRTNRGGPGDVGEMLSVLRASGMTRLSETDRSEILDNLQRYLVERVREYHNRQRLKLVYDPTKTFWHSVQMLLDLAREHGKEGPVAQYLVGAKLQVRFPELEIENRSYSTADAQSGKQADFLVGDTAFHVTVSPMLLLLEKIRTNIEEGFLAYLLVPDRQLQAARQLAEATLPGRITVQSIESFVGQNVEEISAFSKPKIEQEFRNLLKVYNDRVVRVENDRSLLIEIPANLH